VVNWQAHQDLILIRTGAKEIWLNYSAVKIKQSVSKEMIMRAAISEL